jgi:hypothetical protein
MRPNYMNNNAAMSSFKEGGYKSDNTTIEQSVVSGADGSLTNPTGMHGGAQFTDQPNMHYPGIS